VPVLALKDVLPAPKNPATTVIGMGAGLEELSFFIACI
jgi:hypothetical protein